MKQYKRYKPSGIEWIGEIPEHWKMKKLKYLVWTINEKPDHDIDFKLSLENIETKTGRLISPENGNDLQGELRKFQKGDVLFNKLRPYLAKAYLAEKDGGCVGELLVLRSKEELIPEFLFYRVLSYGFIRIVDSSTYGSKMPRASWDDFISQLLIPYPQNEEQSAISNYLDRKIAQIDDLIAKKQSLIDLLNEEKTAIINHAVTKGLNPDTPMKDIGIPWLGKMPAHWEVRKLKYVSKINPEALTENTKEDFRFFYIDISSVDSEGNITDLIELLFKDAPSRARRIVKREDTIISTVRTYLKAIAFIQREDSNLICSTGFSVIRPDPKVFRPKFLFYLLRSDKIINAISSLSKGVSYPAIDSEDLAEIATWFPPREEQDAVLNYIEANKYRIDKTISKINKEIGLLQEYRTALISEAVTGKIDVRI